MAFIDLSKLRGSNSKKKKPANDVPIVAPIATAVDDDQGLLRQVPQDLTAQNSVVKDTGIKEFSGPPVTPVTVSAPVASHPLTANQQPTQAVSKPNLIPVNTNIKASNTQPVAQISNLQNGLDMKKKNPKRDKTKDNKVILSGSAVGKVNQINQIMQEADKKIEAKKTIQSASTPVRHKNVKATTADEKFLANKAQIGELLSVAEQRDASDLHLSAGYPPTLRVNGSLISLGGEVMSEKRLKTLFDSIMTTKQKGMLKDDLDLDFSYTHTSGTRFRINLYHKKGSLAGAFRLIPSKVRTIAELNLPRILYDMLDIPQGLVILAGPTGSGKSTTIASMVQEINMNMSKHILTIEDPIEYIFAENGKSMVNQREIGNDVTSFKRGLREVLREDPDVVLVGEMRDFETIAMTITAAETGHLVFTTLHTNSASQTVDRMIDVFPDAQQAQVRAQLANVLSAVISQRLVPVKSGGRKAVLEIMIATPAIRNAIREAKTYQIDNMIQTNAELGMVTLEKALVEFIRRGEISLEEAQTYTTKPDELVTLMRTN